MFLFYIYINLIPWMLGGPHHFLLNDKKEYLSGGLMLSYLKEGVL